MSGVEVSDCGDYFCPSPRPYQSAILEQAQKENTIVYLPPGTGKTFVAIMLIKLKSEETKERISCGGKRSFFLLDSHALSEQRKEYINKFTSLSVGPCLDDETCLKRLKENTWKRTFEKFQVLVLKAKHFAEILKNKYLELKHVNLLIFDECHSASKKACVIKIMNEYEQCSESERPRIVGLTATLLDKEVPYHKLEKAVAKLETRLHARVASIGDISEIERFVPSPTEKHVPYEEPIPFKFLEEIKTRIKLISEFVAGFGYEGVANHLSLLDSRILYQDIELSRKLVKDLADVWQNIEKMGIYGGSISALKLMMYLQRLGAKATSRDSAVVYLAFIKILVNIREALDRRMEGACEIAKIYEYSSCQVTTLLDVLKEFKLGNNRCIIFVERSSTAEVLYNVLKAASENIENLSFMRPEFVVEVGTENAACARRQYANEGDLEIFERFKSGEINILVTTDILRDGYDMPECKLVIRFDIPKTYRSYILSKGWATLKNSYYVLLTPKKEKRDIWNVMIEYRSKEEFLNQILSGECVSVTQMPEVSFDYGVPKLHKN